MSRRRPTCARSWCSTSGVRRRSPVSLRRARHLADGLAALMAGPEQPRRALATGRTLFALGRARDARIAFERGLEKASEADPETAGWLAAGPATAVWLTGLSTGKTLEPSSPPSSADTAGDRALLALHAIEGATRGIPATEVRQLAERALARGALLDDEKSDGLSYYLAAGALAFAGDLQMAEAALTAAVQEAQARGSVLGFATASHARAMTILKRGRLKDAALDARHALAVERDGWRLGLGGTQVVLAHTLIERGDLEGAGRHLTAAQAATNEENTFRCWLLSARGRLALFNGDAERALRALPGVRGTCAASRRREPGGAVVARGCGPRNSRDRRLDRSRATDRIRAGDCEHVRRAGRHRAHAACARRDSRPRAGASKPSRPPWRCFGILRPLSTGRVRSWISGRRSGDRGSGVTLGTRSRRGLRARRALWRLGACRSRAA